MSGESSWSTLLCDTWVRLGISFIGQIHSIVAHWAEWISWSFAYPTLYLYPHLKGLYGSRLTICAIRSFYALSVLSDNSDACWTTQPLIETGYLESYLVSNNCLDMWSCACAFALQKSDLAFNHDRWHCNNLSFLTVPQREFLRCEWVALTSTSRETILRGQEREKYEMAAKGIKGFQSERELVMLSFVALGWNFRKKVEWGREKSKTTRSYRCRQIKHIERNAHTLFF